MTGVRVLAALIMTAACGGVGYSAARTQTRRRRALAELGQAVDRLEINMLEQRLPLAEALRRAGHPLFERAAKGLDELPPEESLRRAAEELSARMGPLDALTRDDMTALHHLAGELGRYDAHRQRLLLHETRGELRALEEQASRQAAEKNRLYVSLGALGGLMLSAALI